MGISSEIVGSWLQHKSKKSEGQTPVKKQSARTAEVESDCDDHTTVLTTHALASVSRGKWIVDSGATRLQACEHTGGIWK